MSTKSGFPLTVSYSLIYFKLVNLFKFLQTQSSSPESTVIFFNKGRLNNFCSHSSESLFLDKSKDLKFSVKFKMFGDARIICLSDKSNSSTCDKSLLLLTYCIAQTPACFVNFEFKISISG